MSTSPGLHKRKNDVISSHAIRHLDSLNSIMPVTVPTPYPSSPAPSGFNYNVRLLGLSRSCEYRIRGGPRMETRAARCGVSALSV
ncbi:hypothetical protein Bpfe_005038 [Biomphalaria pfeifferi]|uniref:Uncharacterized protein n=1 Tax=Biomphalaria pfeifferi TaxID=112525 RepID=A0AAD8C3N2_BIOPF|nr:hypothetical protein Bpfe_005038 [Biomphalaria pfeifferi]